MPVAAATAALALAAILLVALRGVGLFRSLRAYQLFVVFLFGLYDVVVLLFDGEGGKLQQALDLDRVFNGLATIDRKMRRTDAVVGFGDRKSTRLNSSH